MTDDVSDDLRRRTNHIAEQIETAGRVVSNTLGAGFLEKVYENALAWELRRLGLKVEQQKPVTVCYEGVEVGRYEADLLVEDLVIVELKAAKAVGEANYAQCINYLRATGLKLCLLMNFGVPRMECRRVVYRL